MLTFNLNKIKLEQMKEYDLSKYILQNDTLFIFPLTKDEVQILKQGAEEFSGYIKIPYLAKIHSGEFLDVIFNNISMDDDYWFLNSIWMCVDTKARAIVGTVKLDSDKTSTRMLFQVSENACASVSKNDVQKLFYRFLSGNEYQNIVAIDMDEANYED